MCSRVVYHSTICFFFYLLKLPEHKGECCNVYKEISVKTL
jgi:hypothetical protein